jgi:hypothetical protein
MMNLNDEVHQANDVYHPNHLYQFSVGMIVVVVDQ